MIDRVDCLGIGSGLTERLERAVDSCRICRYDDTEAMVSAVSDREPDCLVVDGDHTGDPLDVFDRVQSAFDGPTLLYGGTTTPTEALDAGVTDVIRKGDESQVVLANRVRNAVERHRAERRARRRDQQLDGLLECSSDRLSVLDESGQYTFVSPAFERLLGYEQETMLGESGFEYVHPEDRDRVRSAFESVLDQSGESTTVQYRIRDAEGTWRIVESTGTNRLDDPAIEGVVVNSREITEQEKQQRELEYKRSLLEALVQTSLQGTVVIDDDRNIVLYNERFHEMWGIPEEVMETRSDREALDYVLEDLENPDQFLETVESLYENPNEESRDIIRLSDGRVFERYTDAVTGEDGTYYGRMWSFRDITEQREQERQLAEEQVLTETTFEALPDVLYAFDQYGNFLRWNDRLEEVTGYTAEEIQSMHPADFVAEEDRPVVFEAIGEVFETDTTVTVEARFETKAGERIPYEFTGSKMVDDSGDPLGLVGIGRDVSDRKQRQRRFEAVFNNTYQFTGLMEPDGTLLEVNQTALNFGGLDREDVVGEKLWDAAWFQHSEEVREYAREAVEEAQRGNLYREEVTVEGASDTEVIDFSVRPIVDEHGEVQLLIPEGRTITDLKRRERHLGVLHRFLRHNLRNKMTVIEGNAGLLADELEGSSYVEYVDQIEGAATDLVELSETAHELSQVAIDTTADPKPVDVGQTLQSVRKEIRDTHPTAAVNFPSDVDRQVRADWRLSVVFEQLVENAIEHNDTDEPTVEVSVDTAEEEVTVAITDDGPGIPEDELAGITTDQEQTQLTHGSGFGLWLVRSVVDDYGGDLSYERGPDGESTLLVTLQRTSDMGAVSDSARERGES